MYTLCVHYVFEDFYVFSNNVLCILATSDKKHTIRIACTHARKSILRNFTQYGLMLLLYVYEMLKRYTVCSLKTHGNFETHSKHIAYTDNRYSTYIVDFFQILPHPLALGL